MHAPAAGQFEWVYRCAKQHSAPGSHPHSERGADGPHLRSVPLLCPLCGGQMRIIAFITYIADIRQMLELTGVETEPPRITPTRVPPL